MFVCTMSFLYGFPPRFVRGMGSVLAIGGGKQCMLIDYGSHRRCLHCDSTPFRHSGTYLSIRLSNKATDNLSRGINFDRKSQPIQ